MLIGFLIQSLIFYGLIYFGGADWGASFMIYTMFFALFVLFTSIPAKKVKGEIAALLGKMYAGDPSDNANLLEKMETIIWLENIGNTHCLAVWLLGQIFLG